VAGQDYRDLFAWQHAIDLVESIYRLTREWPKEEAYALTNQIRRAAVSIPSNIAEGQGRNTTKEFVHFLGVANGSVRELETQILIAARLHYTDEAACAAIMKQATDTGNLLRGLIRSLRE
jgi:four helix bundle protein